MEILEIITIAISLSMDTFAICIVLGIMSKQINITTKIKYSLSFALFQGTFPIMGFLIGRNFKELIERFDHWIAFIILASLGIKMIVESCKKDELSKSEINFKKIIMLSIATSIDAFAIGISFAFLNVNIIVSAVIIAAMTLSFAFIGLTAGKKFGNKIKKSAEIFGGIALILVGAKILIEHLLT